LYCIVLAGFTNASEEDFECMNEMADNLDEVLSSYYEDISELTAGAPPPPPGARVCGSFIPDGSVSLIPLGVTVGHGPPTSVAAIPSETSLGESVPSIGGAERSADTRTDALPPRDIHTFPPPPAPVYAVYDDAIDDSMNETMSVDFDEIRNSCYEAMPKWTAGAGARGGGSFIPDVSISPLPLGVTVGRGPPTFVAAIPSQTSSGESVPPIGGAERSVDTWTGALPPRDMHTFPPPLPPPPPPPAVYGTASLFDSTLHAPCGSDAVGPRQPPFASALLPEGFSKPPFTAKFLSGLISKPPGRPPVGILDSSSTFSSTPYVPLYDGAADMDRSSSLSGAVPPILSADKQESGKLEVAESAVIAAPSRKPKAIRQRLHTADSSRVETAAEKAEEMSKPLDLRRNAASAESHVESAAIAEPIQVVPTAAPRSPRRGVIPLTRTLHSIPLPAMVCSASGGKRVAPRYQPVELNEGSSALIHLDERDTRSISRPSRKARPPTLFDGSSDTGLRQDRMGLQTEKLRGLSECIGLVPVIAF